MARLLRRRSRAAGGIFISHRAEPRVTRHFERLVEETGALVDWHFVLSGATPAPPQTDFEIPDFDRVLPSRRLQMMRAGGTMLPGFMDVMSIPCVLALEREHVWVMEYDVDFAGDWRRFFGRFAGRDADLLTSTLAHISTCEDWAHWPTARYPAWVDRCCVHRAFHPLLRISRRFAVTYAEMMLDGEWEGHAEFTIPTAALAARAGVEDLGGNGPLTPPHRCDVNYLNTPSDPDLSPGTFVWRPVREHYFHERPSEFQVPGRLYHPVKPGVPAWEGTI